MLYKIKATDIKHSIPTIGINLEEARYKNLNILSWDSGGRTRVRIN